MKKLSIIFLLFYLISNVGIAQSVSISTFDKQNGSGFSGDNSRMDCDAWFAYEVLQTGLMHFYAFTVPTAADLYLWDFGDGETGTGEDVEHFFDPALGNSFLVSLTTITYDSLTQDSCVANYEEEVWVYNGVDCVNFFYYSVEDSITFTFYGESYPEAFYYEWDFGDGQIDTGQIVEHTFNPALADVFIVSLTTLSYDSLYNDTCMSFSSQPVYLGITPECEAYFTYEQNPVDPFTFSFFDGSTGNINTWEWYFSDSTISNEQNPVHVFPGPGEYIVCLTVFNDSIFCIDTYCDTIIIEETPLVAGFNFELDSLSQTPNKYHFFDVSTGDPETWLWDFGDGTTSGEMSPVHIYEESGSYLVCLEISKNTFNGIVTDSYCELITTPDYFDFGGVTYLGEFPMNNSGITSDTGMAFLYRKQGTDIALVDTVSFYQYGYYWFAEVLQGEYIVKIKLTSGSEHFNDFLPSYYKNSLFWKEADPVELLDSNNYAMDISLTEIQETETGIGSVEGFVSVEGDCLNGMDLSGMTIILFDDSDKVVAFTETDGDGLYSFGNLPFGEYSLYAEASGLSTEDVAISLNEENYTLNDIELTVNCDNTIGYPEYAYTELSVVDVYPNPVTNNFKIDIESDNNSIVKLCIYSITGQKVIEKEFSVTSGTNTLFVNASALQKGSYLLSVFLKDKKLNAFRKFVK